MLRGIPVITVAFGEARSIRKVKMVMQKSG